MARPISEFPQLTERNGVYCATWYDPKQRRTRRLSLATREADTAQARFAAFLAEGKAIISGDASPAKLTVNEVIDAYLDEHVKKQCVASEHRSRLFRAVRLEFGKRAISSLAINDFETYAEKRRNGALNANANGARNATNGTIHCEIWALRTAVNHAIHRRRMDSREAPIWAFPEKPKVKCDKWLTMEEIDTLQGAATSRRVEIFIPVAYWTAGRKTAVEMLQVNRVDFDAQKIDLHPPGARRTKKRNAVVPIMRELESILKVELKGKRPEDLVIGGGCSIAAHFTETVKAAGFEDRGVTPHWLRHSRATHLLQRGKALFHVAGLLGDTMQTVERVYGHHCPDNLREALE